MKTRAIVLHALRYGDASLVVEVYTEQAGRQSLMVHLARGRRSSLRASLFQPLALLDIETDTRPTADLWRPKTVAVEHPLTTLPYEPAKAAIAMFMAEFLYRTLHRDEAAHELFHFLHHSIAYLDTCTAGYANFHIVFLLHLSRFLGIRPNDADYADGRYFDLQAGRFTPLPPVAHRHFLGRDESRQLHQLMRLRYTTMHLFAMTRADRKRCLQLMDQYFRLHLPAYPELRSLEVLQQLFD